MTRCIVPKEPGPDLIATPKAYIGDAVSYTAYAALAAGYLVPKFWDKAPAIKPPAWSTAPFLTRFLRDYQVTPVQTACQVLASKGGAILRAPCGAGKSSMAVAVAMALGKDTVILVDQLNIAEQWMERIKQYYPTAGVRLYSGSHRALKYCKDDVADYKIIVSQALARQEWLETPLKCSLLVVDEAHVFSAPYFVKSIHNIDFDFSLGLTATDDRKDGLDWVFKICLGTDIIDVQAPRLAGTLISPPFILNGDDTDYFQAYCVRNRKMTWRANCRRCPHFDKFPRECGGRLPVSDVDNQVKWNSGKLNFLGLVKDLVDDPKYLDFSQRIAQKLAEKGRNLFVFSQFKKPLEELYERLGRDISGRYMGGSMDSNALGKQVTLTTYAMSNKALDVPEKDTAFLMSPVSDIRQTAGRIVRILPGKKDPAVIDPDIQGSPILKAIRRKRLAQYKLLGFTDPHERR